MFSQLFLSNVKIKFLRFWFAACMTIAFGGIISTLSYHLWSFSSTHAKLLKGQSSVVYHEQGILGLGKGWYGMAVFLQIRSSKILDFLTCVFLEEPISKLLSHANNSMAFISVHSGMTGAQRLLDIIRQWNTHSLHILALFCFASACIRLRHAYSWHHWL